MYYNNMARVEEGAKVCETDGRSLPFSHLFPCGCEIHSLFQGMYCSNMEREVAKIAKVLETNG